MKNPKKPTRSLSGVLPVAVVTKPIGCKHNCLYCPSLDVPKSYTPESPAILRAKALDYDPYKQVVARLNVLKAMGHVTNKIELIFIGGTFLETEKYYQYAFVKACYDALNKKRAKSLEEAKSLNENSDNRVVAFCIETRPDVCSKDDILRLLDFGVTRVELGVQAIDDKILCNVNRGHGVKEIKEATQRLRDSAFKIGYHFMPGLPGSSFEKDVKMYKRLFEDESFKPDHVKIYPTQVIKGSGLERLYCQGKYQPYTKTQLIELLIRLKLLTPRYCRIMRVMREVPRQWLVAGIVNINLRQEIKEIMEKRGQKCQCIRCREAGFAGFANASKFSIKDVEIKVTEYKANKGKEFFIEALANDILLGLIRLRFPYKPFIPLLKNKALVRELHVYGKALALKENAKAVQHRGIGKLLLETAEETARQKYDAIAVISGVGARQYYRKLGYVLEQNYMVKKL
jgi:elongator complex protein 3